MFDSLKRKIDYEIIKKQGGDKTSNYARKKAKRRGVEIGLHTYGSCFNEGFNIGGTVEIGRYCSFGPNVKYFGGNHPMGNASMSPYFYKREWGFNVRDIERMKLIVGNDVWIGCGVIITSSCRYIGNGAVIGAGAVVTRDVPPYSVVVGVPARIKHYRFDEKAQEKLEKSKWWEKEPDELIKYYNDIGNPVDWAQRIIDASEEKERHINKE